MKPPETRGLHSAISRPDGRFSAGALDLNATLAQAGAALEPEQLEVFATMLERSETSREMTRLAEEAKR